VHRLDPAELACTAAQGLSARIVLGSSYSGSRFPDRRTRKTRDSVSIVEMNDAVIVSCARETCEGRIVRCARWRQSMEVRFLAIWVVTLIGPLGLLGCSIQIPDGVISCVNDADCPSGFRCASGGAEPRCVRGPAPAADGGVASADGGTAARPDTGVGVAADGGGTVSENSVPAAPTFHGFTTSGATALDGFEKGGRVCTPNGRYCLTGAFEP